MQNLPWEVEFDYDADRNGLVSVSVSFHVQGSTEQLPRITGMITTQIFVRKGDTAEQKCARIVAGLRRDLGAVIDITYENGDDDFKMKVKDTPGGPVPGAIAIAGFSKVDNATGEGITGVKDDPGEDGAPELTAYFLMEGKGSSKNGIAQIQLGRKHPLIEVPTKGKSAEEVIEEMVAAFNETYARLGFVAEPWYFGPTTALDEAAGLSIEKVPCPLGLRAGAQDAGLITEMGLVTMPGPVFDFEADDTELPQWRGTTLYDLSPYSQRGDGEEKRVEKKKEKDGDDPRDTPPPVIYGEEIDSACNPVFINGIGANDCDPKGVDITSTCRGTMTGFIFPGSLWMNNVGGAVAEINRSIAFFAQYCINLELNQLNLSASELGKMESWYTDWFRRVVQYVGGENRLGRTSISSDLNNEFLGAMAGVQKLARKRGVKLLVIFINEYITDHRPTLVSGVRRNFQQIGINWVDRNSPYILAHELVHALGKSAHNRPGPVTWSHNSPCQNALTTIQRRDARDPINLSGRYLEIAEHREIVRNRGGRVLRCRRGGCKAD